MAAGPGPVPGGCGHRQPEQGRALAPGAVELAVVASVRHEDTGYDELLMTGIDRADARERVRDDADRMLERWRRG